MTQATFPYVVRQGDYLTKVAFVAGTSADEAWDLPANEALRTRRKDYELLVPGDVVHLPKTPRPGHDISAGTVNKYRAIVPRVSAVVCFTREGKPLANKAFLVRGLEGADDLEGRTDDEGAVKLEIPVHIREVCVHFYEDGHSMYRVRVGDLDPHDDGSGAGQRLRNLGFIRDSSGIESSEERAVQERYAVAAFQKSRGLDVTGLADEATLAALVEAHGS